MKMMCRSFLGFLTSLPFIGFANAEGEAVIDHLPIIETAADT